VNLHEKMGANGFRTNQRGVNSLLDFPSQQDEWKLRGGKKERKLFVRSTQSSFLDNELPRDIVIQSMKFVLVQKKKRNETIFFLFCKDRKL